MSIPLIYSPFYTYRFPAGHQFPMSKFAHLKNYLDEKGYTKQNNIFRPGQVKEEVLRLSHDTNYINRFKNNLLDKKEMRQMGLPWSEELVRRSLISPNGTLLTASIALNHGIACHLAGGTHHAHYDHGRGYCIFNDLAIAAQAIIQQRKANRILIFDCDVHQGDGTASILKDQNAIFTCSIHCQKNYPHRKSRSDLDVGLDKGTSDEEYLHQVVTTMHKAIQLSQPDLILYDAGVDIYSKDRLGFLNVSFDGIRKREFLVLTIAKQKSIPIATVIGGGYDHDQKSLAKRHALIIEQAFHVFS